ncbi:hypothetical protein [Coleofasciculus chthonoplastes]|jgi:hypothetical protein|uniref:hypothetical protein n=1 Tax=Coleofasciculus chthonoplastes TaxID=64178 RepID=UPI0032FDF5AE
MNLAFIAISGLIRYIRAQALRPYIAPTFRCLGHIIYVETRHGASGTMVTKVLIDVSTAIPHTLGKRCKFILGGKILNPLP